MHEWPPLTLFQMRACWLKSDSHRSCHEGQFQFECSYENRSSFLYNRLDTACLQGVRRIRCLYRHENRRAKSYSVVQLGAFFHSTCGISVICTIRHVNSPCCDTVLEGVQKNKRVLHSYRTLNRPVEIAVHFELESNRERCKSSVLLKITSI